MSRGIFLRPLFGSTLLLCFALTLPGQLNRGVIEEQGTHDKLICNGGLYAHLHNTVATAGGRGFSHTSS